jgi:quercetin dioxygenase-like cupin family protein
MHGRLYRWRRATILAALMTVASFCMIVSAQQANFTGAVRNVEAKNLRAVRFQYDPGARSYWHIHEGSQILMLEQGRGRVQLQGQPVREMVPNQPVFLPGGVAHWHGAAPNEGLTQLALNEGGVKWLQAVTEQEYRAEIKR